MERVAVSRNAKPKRRRKGLGKRKTQRHGKVRRKHRVGPRSSPRKRKSARTRHKAKSSPRRPRSDPRLEIAVREMNRGRSLTAVARSLGFSAKALQELLGRKRLLKRRGKRWVTKDNRLRRIEVMTGGRLRVLTVRGYKQAQLIGEHHHAAGQFVRTNAVEILKRFRGRTVQAVNGRRYVLDTDPNVLHRIAAMDSPPFHEIYAITSSS